MKNLDELRLPCGKIVSLDALFDEHLAIENVCHHCKYGLFNMNTCGSFHDWVAKNIDRVYVSFG